MGDLLSQQDLQLLTWGLAAFVVILFIIVIGLWVKVVKGGAKFKRLLNGASSINLEQLLLDIQGSLNEQRDQSTKQSQSIEAIQTKLTKLKAHLAIHRYNAFGDTGTGSDLSFSIALLDEQKDGIVLTGIHNREMTYIYAKPIDKGGSSYSLTPEEKEAITLTSKKV